MLLTFSDWKSAEIRVWNKDGSAIITDIGHVEIRFVGSEITHQVSLDVEAWTGDNYCEQLEVKSCCEAKFDTLMKA